MANDYRNLNAMNHFKSTLLLSFFVIIIFFSSCSSPSIKQKSDFLDKPHIKRPLTLPKDLRKWNFQSAYIFSSLDENSLQIQPLVWSKGITDNLTLLYWPLPLAVKYQFLSKESMKLGILGGITGMGYDQDIGGYLKFSGELLGHFILNDKYAIFVQTGYSSKYNKEFGTFTKSYILKNKLMMQFNKKLLLSPILGLTYSENKYYSIIPSSIYSETRDVQLRFSIWKLNTHVGADITKITTKNHEFTGGYEFHIRNKDHVFKLNYSYFYQYSSD